MKRAAAFLAVAHFVGFESFTTVLLGLTPQALCCRAAPQAQIGAFKTGSLIIMDSSRRAHLTRQATGYLVFKQFHGDHEDKSGRAMTFHYLIPVIPVSPLDCYCTCNCK